MLDLQEITFIYMFCYLINLQMFSFVHLNNSASMVFAFHSISLGSHAEKEGIQGTKKKETKTEGGFMTQALFTGHKFQVAREYLPGQY